MKEANTVDKFKAKLDGHWTGIENSTTSGVPDYVAARNGKMYWVEFKRLYGCDIIVRPLQRTWMIRELRHNTRTCVAWWDQGPVVLLSRHLMDINPVEKGGKLHYNVADHPHNVYGFLAIDKLLFKD